MRKRFRPGVGFGDFVIADSMSRRTRIDDTPQRDFRRGWLVWLGVVLGLGVLVFRLVTLQVVYGARYKVFSDENRVKKVRLPAARGRILDRNGVVLADNKAVEKKDGLGVRTEWVRTYPHGEIMGNVVGYLGEVKEDEVGLLKEQGGKYEVGDTIGRAGLEMVYEEKLRGVDGGKLVEVDNQGNLVRELGTQLPKSGTDLRLGLDVEIQQTAYDALKGKKGAAVVSEPGTGTVVALVTVPNFDPNLFADPGVDEGKLARVLTDKNLPLFDRSIGGVYPPGSTFKMATTIAAIESGKVKPGFTFLDEGVIRIGIYEYYNWLFTKRHATEGQIGFARAIARSTDTFFYKIGEMMGPEILADWSRRVGFAEKTGIDLPGEVEGLLPVPAWKMETKREKWFLGDTFIVSIGQGDVLSTPVQVNRMTNVMATRGYKCALRLRFEEGMEDLPCDKVEVSVGTWEIVQKGMVSACSTDGTAYPLFDWNDAAKAGREVSEYAEATLGELPTIACKTGTAEYWDIVSNKMKTHGWLTAYLPVEKPQISVTVLVEGGGEGSDVAAPVVRKIAAEYFKVQDTYPYGSIKLGLGE